jgi:hypothetical protein
LALFKTLDSCDQAGYALVAADERLKRNKAAAAIAPDGFSRLKLMQHRRGLIENPRRGVVNEGFNLWVVVWASCAATCGQYAREHAGMHANIMRQHAGMHAGIMRRI